MNQPNEEKKLTLADLCMQVLDGVVQDEVGNPVVRQVYSHFRPQIARTLAERVPMPCRDSER